MPTAPRERRWWTSSEDEVLQNKAQIQMDRYGSVKNWNEIAALLPHRTNKDCRKRWYKVRRDIRKGAWMPEEDKQLEDAVAQVGLKWSTVARMMQTRNADQCAKRWQHVLGPDFKHAPWTAEEDRILIDAIAKYGNNWKQLGQSELPDRSTHDIRNRSVTLSRRNGRANASSNNPNQQKPLPPSPGPSEAPSLEDDCSSRRSSLDSDADASSPPSPTSFLQPCRPDPGAAIPTSDPDCWPPSALMHNVLDEPFFPHPWDAALDPSSSSSSSSTRLGGLRAASTQDFDPWMQLDAATTTATTTTGLQTPADSEFLMTPPTGVVKEDDPLDLCFLDQTLAGATSGGMSPEEIFSAAGGDSGLGSSPQAGFEFGGECGVAAPSAVTAAGNKGSVTVLLRQSDSHLTQGVVRGLMGLDVELTIRVVKD